MCALEANQVSMTKHKHIRDVIKNLCKETTRKLCFISPPYTHYIIVNNIDSKKLTVTMFATNLTKILINI